MTSICKDRDPQCLFTQLFFICVLDTWQPHMKPTQWKIMTLNLHCLGRRLQTLVNYALKAERDLWGVLDGPWDGPDYANYRRSWSSQVPKHLTFHMHFSQ